jgi:hypothetical protein
VRSKDGHASMPCHIGALVPLSYGGLGALSHGGLGALTYKFHLQVAHMPRLEHSRLQTLVPSSTPPSYTSSLCVASHGLGLVDHPRHGS